MVSAQKADKTLRRKFRSVPESTKNSTNTKGAREEAFEPMRGAESHPKDDEVSLRELYLIFRRGLPWIVGAALLAGALAFALTLRDASVFETSAVVLVSPLPVEGEPAEEVQRLSLNQSGAVPFEAYRELAFSEAVLTDALSRMSDVDLELSAAGLRAAGRLQQDTRPNQTGEDVSLVVTHLLTFSDPERAAALADAWAQSTVAAVRDLRSATLAEIEEATGAAAAQLEETLQRAETRLQTFQTQNQGDLAAARSEALTAELVAGEAELRTLSRAIDASRARLETLRAQRQTNTPSRVSDVQREEITLSGLLAEQRSLQAQLQSIEETLQTQPTAESDQQELELLRTVERAQSAFQSVSDAQTRAAYLRELVPATAQLLSRASVPNAPVDTPSLPNIILAAFAGALFATLFIFLRAAVKPPKAPASTSTQSSHINRVKPISESRG